MGRVVGWLLCLLLPCLMPVAAANKTVWGECLSPGNGDTTDGFFYYVNIPYPVVSGDWELQVSGATNFTAAPNNGSFVPAPNSSTCIGTGSQEAAFWYRFGPFALNVGDHFRQFEDLGGAESFVEEGPPVVQGEVDECQPHPCGERARCQDLPLKNGYICHCNPGYIGDAGPDGANCTASPWAHYADPSTTFSGRTWKDSSGNGRNATSAVGFEPTLSGRTLIFGTGDTLNFPVGSLPDNFTIFIAARYASQAGTHARILQTEAPVDWLLGWFRGNEDVAFFGDQWMTTPGEPALVATPSLSYRRIVGRNSPAGATVFVEGANVSTTTGGLGSGALIINGPGGQSSDCEVQEILIFDGHLIDEDIINISRAMDVDECATNPCNVNSTCVDSVAPLTGHTCVCRSGWEGANSTDGAPCVDLDACVGTPCGLKADCTDLLAPLLGHNCSCKAGFEGIPGLDGEGCTDVNGCVGVVCPAFAECVDNLPPALGFECVCESGFINATGTCTDLDACVNHTCGSLNSCVDLPPPSLTYDCDCDAERGFGLAANRTSCIDVDGCAEQPCGAHQSCVDIPVPNPGRVCSCHLEFEFSSTAPTVCVLKTPETIMGFGKCRASGAGGEQDACGFPGDASCNGTANLACHTGLDACMPNGNGLEADLCGVSGATTCNASLALICGPSPGLSANDGASVAVLVCRSAGNSSAGDACSSNLDAPCNSAVAVCDTVSETHNVTCVPRPTGTNPECGRTGDPLCPFENIGVNTCGHEQTGARSRCRLRGAGLDGEPCDSATDAVCDGLCAVASNGFGECRRAGNGTLGASCGQTGDTACEPATLLCDLQNGVCRVPGTGAFGGRCGQRGDAACGAGLVCARDSTDAWGCRIAGNGTLDSVCGHERDGACDSGLACSTQVECPAVIPDLAALNAEQQACSSRGFGDTCNVVCAVNHVGPGASYVCSQFGLWVGTMTCELDVQADGSNNGEFFATVLKPGLTLYIVVAIAGLLLLVALILLIRKLCCRKKQKAAPAPVEDDPVALEALGIRRLSKTAEESRMAARKTVKLTRTLAAPAAGGAAAAGSKPAAGAPLGDPEARVIPDAGAARRGSKTNIRQLSKQSLQNVAAAARRRSASVAPAGSKPASPAAAAGAGAGQGRGSQESNNWFGVVDVDSEQFPAEPTLDYDPDNPGFDVEDFIQGMASAGQTGAGAFDLEGAGGAVEGDEGEYYEYDPDAEEDYGEGYEGVYVEDEDYDLGAQATGEADGATEAYDEDLDGLVWTEGYGFLFQGDPRIGRAKAQDLKMALDLAMSPNDDEADV